MERPARSAFGELAVATLLFAIVSLASWPLQKITLIRYWDSDEYYWMTYNMATGQPIRASAPWVYRIGVPWLASIRSRLLRGLGSPSYPLPYPSYAINIASALAAPGLLFLWLRRSPASPAVRLVVAALSPAAGHGRARFVYFYPMYVDPPF